MKLYLYKLCFFYLLLFILLFVVFEIQNISLLHIARGNDDSSSKKKLELCEEIGQGIPREKIWNLIVKKYWELVKSMDIEILPSSLTDCFINNENYSLWSSYGVYETEEDPVQSAFIDVDRIVPQLVFVLEGYNHKALQHVTQKKILLHEGYSWWNYNGNFSKKCPGWRSKCEFVDNELKYYIDEDPHAVVVVKDFYHTKRVPFPESVKIFYFNLEPPIDFSFSTSNRNVLMTFWRKSDVVAPYGKWVYYDPNVRNRVQNVSYAKGKTRMAAIFLSNCNANNNRLEYVQELQKYTSVDVFGNCGTKFCPRDKHSQCVQMLRRDYKFYLAFENSNCRDYVTEKFFENALKNNVVPIVLGAHPDDYHETAPKNSYIHIDHFTSAKELAKYMNKLDDSEYAKYFQWKGTGEFIDGMLFCRICAMLHYADLVPPSRQNYIKLTVSNKKLCQMNLQNVNATWSNF